MKKIALTSLLAVFAAAGANAANTFDGNPLYMPQKGHFYSETSLSSDTKNVDEVSLGETFGFGITDRLAISLNTSASEANWFDGKTKTTTVLDDGVAGQTAATEVTEEIGNGNAWNELGADLTWRVINDSAWKLDIMGGFEMMPVWGDHMSFMDKNATLYAWTAGVRGGYVTEDWTLAAHANFIYLNTEAFNWGDDDADYEGAAFWANHMLNLGVAGHWTMSDTWSAVASADYFKVMDHYNEVENKGWWELSLGLNMNIDDTKYVGAYLTKEIAREVAGGLNVDDVNGYGFGLKFGIDF